MNRILIIEDQDDIALSLKYNLEQNGFAALVAADGEAGLAAAREEPPGLILLDLNLPGMDGLEVCRLLRADPRTAGVPVIMLTARAGEADTVRGLDVGADDYVAKPFSIRELLARVRAVLRRGASAGDEQELRSGELRIELASRRVHTGSEEVSLTRREFDLLADLLRNAGRVRTRDKLLEQVWGYDHPGATRTVDVHIRHLRRKLGPPFDERIETMVGVGYRFRDEP